MVQLLSFYTINQFRDQIRQRKLPWTAKQMLVGIRSPRGGPWDTSRIPDITILSHEIRLK